MRLLSAQDVERNGELRMEINGRTKLYGIIGNPVEHTLSPLIHGTFADMLGIDMVYVPFQVAQGELEAAVRGAYGLNICGMNVTVPYKNAVIPFLEEVDARAQAVGSVNTLVRGREGYVGHNTDMSGLRRAMEEDGISLRDEQVIVLGAGGVGRAVAFMCADSGAQKVYLVNRSAEKAECVAQEVNRALQRCGKDCVTAMPLAEYQKLLTGPKNRYIALQCTSVGLAPNVDDVVLEDGDFYHYVKFGYDLIYTPWQTRFMQCVQDNGGVAYNGLKMLLYQGIDAFELWTGCKVSRRNADRVYQKLQERLL